MRFKESETGNNQGNERKQNFALCLVTERNREDGSVCVCERIERGREGGREGEKANEKETH